MPYESDPTNAARKNRANFSWAVALPVLLVLGTFSGGQARGAETVVEGTVHVCSSCHGFGGRSISPTFPRLAGQQFEYIEEQLHAFRDHTRADPHAHTYMWGMAARLSDETIGGLASYYSSQQPVPGTPRDPALMVAGEKIFKEGIPARDVPACMACHGEKGEGSGVIPRLAGQHPGYIEEQLVNFISQKRASDIMHQNSENLTPEEIRQIAAYVGSL